LTGICNGKGKVNLRCVDKNQSEKLIESLKEKGVSFTIKSQMNPKDIQMT
jgi:hypothetical protein